MEDTRDVQRLFDDIARHKLSRRSVLARAMALGLSAPTIAALLAACGGDDDDDTSPTATSGAAPSTATSGTGAATATSGTAPATATTTGGSPVSEATATTAGESPANGKKGGTLRVAQIGEPSTLDQHQTTAGLTADIGYCMYETLFAYDQNYQPIPMLAESYDVSDDGMTHTFKIRQGVPFHNGEEMSSADVLASIERWGRLSGVGKNVMKVTESVTAPDANTIEWKTTSPYGTILIALCSNTQACAIYPKSLLDKSTDEPINSTDIIGTGPYRLVEHQPDAYIRFERFDDYAAIAGDVNGYGGHKYQWPDKIEFVPVPDVASRVAGMQAGDYHIAAEISNDQYDVLKGDDTLRVEILPPSQWDVFFLNWKSPLMSNENLRKAFQACLDHLPIMQSSRGGGDFIQLNPALMMKPTPWYTEVGGELYNIHDVELAKKYLTDGGYDNTPVRFMCTQEYSYMYGAAIVAKQQMEQAGFVVDLQVTDWATVLQRRAKPEEWDIFVTGHGFVPDPTQITYVGQMNIYPGWWSDPTALQLAEQLASETDFDTRFGIWEQIQKLAYETVPAVKTGDSSTIAVWSKQVGGFTTQLQRGVPYWNVWLNE